jgi:uncharacterized protein YozE (UPF0346 family)
MTILHSTDFFKAGISTVAIEPRLPQSAFPEHHHDFHELVKMPVVIANKADRAAADGIGLAIEDVNARTLLHSTDFFKAGISTVAIEPRLPQSAFPEHHHDFHEIVIVTQIVRVLVKMPVVIANKADRAAADGIGLAIEDVTLRPGSRRWLLNPASLSRPFLNITMIFMKLSSWSNPYCAIWS